MLLFQLLLQRQVSLAAKSSSGNDGSILHFGLTRLRVTGSGNLQQILHSLDDVRSNTLANFAMTSATDVEPTVLANFTQQRAYLEVKVTQISEWFNISKITIFVKPVATSYPQ